MDIQLLHKENIACFSALCSSWELSQVLDPDGAFLSGCIGLGCIGEHAKPCALLLASPNEDRTVYTVTTLRCPRQFLSTAGERLLRTFREYAQLNGARKLVYSYTAPDPIAELLNSCGWSKPEVQGCVYRVTDSAPLLAAVDRLKSENSPVIPFFDVPIQARSRFSQRFGADVDPKSDYNLVVAPDPRLSLACMDGDELAGYLLCCVTPEGLELRCAYVEHSRLPLLGTMAKEFASRCRAGQHDRAPLDIHTHTAFGDQIMHKLLGAIPCQQFRFMTSHLDLMGSD